MAAQGHRTICRRGNISYAVVLLVAYRCLANAGSRSIKTQTVVHCYSELLLASQVTLRGLYGRMPEQKLDLFQVTASFAAELRASPPQIVRTKTLDSNFL